MENTITSPVTQRHTFMPLAFLGLLSGLLTCFIVKNYSDILISPGIFFGVAIALFFVISERKKAVGKIVGFIVLSAIAYFAAFWITFLVFILAGAANPSSPPTSTLLGFLVGGACGAFILFFAAKASLSPFGNRKWYLFTVAGGLLASFSWLIGWIIGGTTHHFAFALYSLYVLWQMGMALVLGAYIRTYEREASQETAVPATSSLPLKSLVGSVLGIILICYVIPQSLSIKFPSMPYAWQEYQVNQIIESTYGLQPSLENLPLVTVGSSSDMMIDHQIGNYSPRTLEPAQNMTATNQDSTGLTQRVVYKELYLPQNFRSADIMAQVAVPVTVTQYPTPAWARYELKDTPEYDYEFSFGEPGTSRNNITENKINKFNSIIYLAMDNSQTPVIPGGVYFWTSGDKVVAICFYQPEDDELIKEYLAKYPSDL